MTPTEPGILPRNGKGYLTVLPEPEADCPAKRERVQLPLIPATGHPVNPSQEELDASAWD